MHHIINKMGSSKKIGLMLILILVLITSFGCSKQDSFIELKISPENVNDVFGSIISDKEVLIIRQEQGIEHIRGFRSSLILSDITSDKETILFESGKIDGLNDSDRKIVIDGPPSVSRDKKSVNISVIESKENEFMPQNTMYTVQINLQDNTHKLFPNKHKKQTAFDKKGDLIASDYSERKIDIKHGKLTIITNFTKGSKKVYYNDELMADMSPSLNFFFNNHSMIFEKDNKVLIKNFKTLKEDVVISSENKNSMKGIYGITNNDDILIESKENAFYLFNQNSGTWTLISKSSPGYSLIVPKFNSMGKIIYNEGNMILLKKLNEKTGDSSLYLYKRTNSNKDVFDSLPMFGQEKSHQIKEVIVGSRKGNLAPEFSLTSSKGETITLSEIKKSGKWTVLFAWATWCPQCSREFNAISNAYNNINPKNLIFVAVDIDISENNDLIQEYSDKKGLGSLQFAMANMELLQNYKIRSTTTKFIIDPKGIIQYKGSGVLSEKHWETIFSVGK